MKKFTLSQILLGALLTLGMVVGTAHAQGTSDDWVAAVAAHQAAESIPTAQSSDFWKRSSERLFPDSVLGGIINSCFGFTVRSANVFWYTQMPPDLTSYFNNNPETVYGGVEIPQWGDYGYSSIFQLDGDDVIALFGHVPPAITYYGFLMNEWKGYSSEEDKYISTNSSIGIGLNSKSIRTADGVFVIIIAAQRNAAQQIRQYFLDMEIPENAINELYIPHRFTRQSSTHPSWLNLLSRLTFRTRAEKAAILAYIQQNPAAIEALFFDGPGVGGDIEDGDLPQWQGREDTSEWDRNADDERDILVQQILKYYQAHGYTLKYEGLEKFVHINSESNCREVGQSCYFDCPDALYGVFLCNSEDTQVCWGILPNKRDIIVIAGVNHHRFGNDNLATYFSYAVNRQSDQQGIAVLNDLAIGEDSAKPFLDGTGLNPQDFFVLTISRKCADKPACLKIPWDNEYKPGIPPLGPVSINTRIYLDKDTATGPNPGNFVPAKLLWFKGPLTTPSAGVGRRALPPHRWRQRARE